MTTTKELAPQGIEGHRIYISFKPEIIDAQAKHYCQLISDYLKLPVAEIKIIKVFTINKLLSDDQFLSIAGGPLIDPIVEESFVNKGIDTDFDWTIEVSYKKGMTDNLARTARIAIEDYLGEPFGEGDTVHSARQFLLKGSLAQGDVELIARDLLANTLIEEVRVYKNDRPIVCEKSRLPVEVIDIKQSDEELLELSKKRQWALNLAEVRAIREHFSSDGVIAARKSYGLPENPTDVEMEALAQTWSEHCKHKIFNARITYIEGGSKEVVDSLFKTYIMRATEELDAVCPFLVSVFSDNAGIIAFNDEYNVCFKVETHNSPSALDPYGGALTGILGVNRDILGAGIGARIVANTDVFCFAPPSYPYPIPKKILHPKRIFEGVRKGVEHGGNKSGVPTVNGAILFDDRFLGKPLVYCGTVGIMPKSVLGKGSHIKEIEAGDRIIIAGGRTGKDGIHGATFSSVELNDESPTSAVQIGDPFTQKKLHDFVLEARDQGLYRTLTDNGAGGFSSSVGELAELSGGCEIHLEKALLKTAEIKPWEILLSESQERMTLAVSSDNVKRLYDLAAKHEVELCDIGAFTSTGFYHVMHHGKTVGLLSLDFVHHGLPQLELEASWPVREPHEAALPVVDDYNEELAAILSRLNVCSKESVIRQYDHEVQGGSAHKPLVGVGCDGPADAAVIRPIETLASAVYHKEGIVISNGICPKFSDHDTYHMAASAIDEALRNYVAVGGNPRHAAILDNFCWPDPVFDPKGNSDGKYKLAQLVRANRALYDYAKAFGLPIISGKDSMKNDFRIGDTKISVPPTLLISAIGKIDDVETSVSMDFKQPGDIVYVLGVTKNEMAGTEYAAANNITGGIVPHVDAEAALLSYLKLHQAIVGGLVASCHDCSDGGLGAAIAESAFAGGFGAAVHLEKVPADGRMGDSALLFSESNSRFVVTVAPGDAENFEKVMAGSCFASVGEVTAANELSIVGVEGAAIVNIAIDELKKAWQSPLCNGVI